MKNEKIVGGYAFRFNEPDLEGKMYTKDSFSSEHFEDLKFRGVIKDYEIDEFGIRIIKSVDVLSYDICSASSNTKK